MGLAIGTGKMTRGVAGVASLGGTEIGGAAFGDNARKILTGQTATGMLDDMGRPVANNFQAGVYDPNAAAYQIGNQYGGALGSALAGASNRGTPITAGPDLGAANATAGNQTALGQLLTARANGTGGPSAAELQMRQGLGAAINAQRAQAASARGLSPGMAQRMAAQGIAGAQMQTNQQTGVLRAQEQLGAQNALGGLLAQQRGQDLNSAQMAQQGAQFNTQTEMQNRQQMDQATQAYIGMGMSREQAQQQALADQEKLKADQQASANTLNAATAEGNADRAQKAKGGLIGAAGAALGSIFSDRNAKTEIREADADTEELLDGMGSYLYKYRDQRHGKGERLGVMAQDVAKSRAGREIVSRHESGLLQLDGKKTLGALLAAAANLNKRVRRMESVGA